MSFIFHKKNLTGNFWNVSVLMLLILISGCSPDSILSEDMDEEGAFLVFRRQSLIGEENYSITSNNNSIIIKSLQGENERGRITGVQAELRLNMNLSPMFYENKRLTNSDTTNIMKVVVNGNEVKVWEKKKEIVTTSKPSVFFPLHSNIPAAMEMMLYQYYFKNGNQESIATLPRGEVSITHTGQDDVNIKGESILLDRYVVEGINWGGRTIWLDKDKKLIALVKANTQIRELIRKGYEEALPTFIAGNVIEQMNALSAYTKDHKTEQPSITALIGGNLITGLRDKAQNDMTVIIENGRIKKIGTRSETEVPPGAKVIDTKGKTLMPGLWDMHAHSNQVQWAPAYLAGGVTTIRDNGNEIEFATAFRDAIALNGALGPDILLAGMTDGAGVRGNGVIRATTPEEAREVVAMYYSKGYKQIKIYTSIEPEIMKILSEEAHKLGITSTGHVPRAVNNAIDAIEGGMDQLSHSGRIMSVLFPDKKLSELKSLYLADNEASSDQIETAAQFLLKHNTVLDPTLSLYVIRGIEQGLPIETVEPDAGRIAYELFEGKRFRNGVSSERSIKAKKDYTRAFKIIGDFYRAGVPIVAGTDNVVPVYSLYLEIESYQKMAGLTPLEAIRTATIIPARAMGLESETGTLEVGKEADIAILDKNPLLDINNIRTVSAVMTNGNYYKSDPLWEAADFIPRNK
ncbi:MAG: amidohydrolase family protein [Saprospiraceae bacterium]|nr:amidohydrolase family protein [Saprospiraceae bacterium]